MAKVSLKEYAPMIIDPKKGDEIYNKIKACDPSANDVVVDFHDIVSMTTECAKLIFGRLFKELGKSLFQRHIIIEGASDEVFLVIKLGLEGVIDEEY